MADKDFTQSLSAGAPKTYTGGFMIADLGTALPTKDTPFAPLDAKFDKGGYVGTDGFKRKLDTKDEDTEAWGGVVIDSRRTKFAVEYELDLLCMGDPVILRRVFGPENVVVTGNVIMLKGNSKIAPRQSFVFEMFDRGLGEREVIANGQILTSADVTFTHAEIKKLPVTIKAFPNPEGDTYVNFKEITPGSAGSSPVTTP